MSTTPLMMAVPLDGAAVSRVDGVKWWTILLVSLYSGCDCNLVNNLSGPSLI